MVDHIDFHAANTVYSLSRSYLYHNLQFMYVYEPKGNVLLSPLELKSDFLY